MQHFRSTGGYAATAAMAGVYLKLHGDVVLLIYLFTCPCN